MRLAEDAGERRWLAFVAQEPLPADAAIEVTVGPGTPSAEGPLRHHQGAALQLPHLRAAAHRAPRLLLVQQRVPAADTFFIEFNNPLDVDSYEESMLRIEPALPVPRWTLGNTITIRGATAGRTTYQVIVSGSLRISFGQTLGQGCRLTFKVGLGRAGPVGPEENLVTLDPALPRSRS
jgi:alpha-2-macroglobulin